MTFRVLQLTITDEYFRRKCVCVITLKENCGKLDWKRKLNRKSFALVPRVFSRFIRRDFVQALINNSNINFLHACNKTPIYKNTIYKLNNWIQSVGFTWVLIAKKNLLYGTKRMFFPKDTVGFKQIIRCVLGTRGRWAFYEILMGNSLWLIIH